jgi:hypothetical protein
MLVILAMVLTCRADDRPVGITLLFQSAGRPVVVLRFDPDGKRGPVPGAVGGMFPRGGAEMSFMPGDSRRGIPTFVEVEWAVPTKEFETWSAERQKKSNAERYTPEGQAEYRQEWAKVPIYTKRIDFTSIITPELVEQVRTDRQNTQLKLIITFNNDNVDIKALAYKWR